MLCRNFSKSDESDCRWTQLRGECSGFLTADWPSVGKLKTRDRTMFTTLAGHSTSGRILILLLHHGADSLQELRRTPRKTINMLVSLLIMVAGAVWNIRDGLYGSSTALIIGCVFALWAIFIALSLIRRRIHVIVEEAALVVNRMVRSPVRIPWSQMETAKLPESAAPAIIAWRASPETNLQYIAVSQRLLGEEGAKVLRSAIYAARPDLQMLR